MTATDTTRATLDLPTLRDAVRGRVITPDDADYDAARAIVYGGIDPRPAAIVRVADARGRGARRSRSPARPGSSSPCGAAATAAPATASIDGGLVIDLARPERDRDRRRHAGRRGPAPA